MKMKIPLLFGLAILTNVSLAQNIIGTTGNTTVFADGSSLSWTIGEPLTESLQNGDVVITQGFHQPLIREVTSVVAPDFGYAMTLAPNPATEDIQILSEYTEPLDFQLMGIDGRLIHQGSILPGKSIPIADLTAGHYLMRLFANGRFAQLFLFEKL